MKFALLVLVVLFSAALKAETAPAPATASVEGKSYPVRQIDPLSRTAPEYPLRAAQEGRGGTVHVGVLVGPKGKVVTTFVEKSDASPDIEQAIRNAVKRWKFPVVKEGGTPIDYVTFTLLSLQPKSNEKPQPEAAKKNLLAIIADTKNLNASMGQKAIVITDEKTGQIPARIQQAIMDTQLHQDRQFYPLPKEAVRPVPKTRTAPEYPAELRRKGISGKAGFLFFIGADGVIKGIYCIESTHPEFAVAAATAMLKWRFSPAMIENTPVPILSTESMEFIPN